MYAIQHATFAEWEAFAAERPDAHLLQRAGWGDFKAQFGWEVERLLLQTAKGPRAGAQILWQRRYGLRFGYVPRGPLWSNDPAGDSLLLALLRRRAHDRRAVFLRLEPNAYAGPAWDARHSELLLAGWEPAPPLQPAASIHLDLAAEPQQLLAGASKGHRADVRRAERLGVTVRVGSTENDFDAFYAMMRATSERAGFAIHSRPYYAQAWRIFGGLLPDGGAALLLAEHEQEVVAAFLVFAVGREAQYMYSGSTEAGLKVGANHALQWAAIQWARQRGCALYDFWGIPEAFADLEDATNPDERALLEAQAQASGMAGVYRFKKGWGGAIVRYAPAYDCVLLRPAYWLWQRTRNA